MGNKFDLRGLVASPLVASSGIIWTRLVFASAWGCWLGAGLGDARMACGAILLGVGVLGSVSFFGWDTEPVRGFRMALYGLFVAGEVLMVGVGAFAVLATFTGVLRPGVMLLCGVGGVLFREYAGVVLHNSNIPFRRGSERL